MKQYIVTAEHTQAQSVSHPCRNGIYDDPADTMELIITAESEAEAVDIAKEELFTAAVDAPPCQCHKHLRPGTSAWWQSVTLAAEQLPD